MSKEDNRKFPARNTAVQLLNRYTDAECHNAQLHRRTDRQTDRRHYDAKSLTEFIKHTCGWIAE